MSLRRARARLLLVLETVAVAYGYGGTSGGDSIIAWSGMHEADPPPFTVAIVGGSRAMKLGLFCPGLAACTPFAEEPPRQASE